MAQAERYTKNERTVGLARPQLFFVQRLIQKHGGGALGGNNHRHSIESQGTSENTVDLQGLSTEIGHFPTVS